MAARYAHLQRKMNPNLKTGPWSHDENTRFLNLLLYHYHPPTELTIRPTRSILTDVALGLETRDYLACRTRWESGFRRVWLRARRQIRETGSIHPTDFFTRNTPSFWKKSDDLALLRAIKLSNAYDETEIRWHELDGVEHWQAMEKCLAWRSMKAHVPYVGLHRLGAMQKCVEFCLEKYDELRIGRRRGEKRLVSTKGDFVVEERVLKRFRKRGFGVHLSDVVWRFDDAGAGKDEDVKVEEGGAEEEGVVETNEGDVNNEDEDADEEVRELLQDIGDNQEEEVEVRGKMEESDNEGDAVSGLDIDDKALHESKSNEAKIREKPKKSKKRKSKDDEESTMSTKSEKKAKKQRKHLESDLEVPDSSIKLKKKKKKEKSKTE
ncbi:hypothetical protein HDU99_000752 [Rhizoclosmatium hyalinum]|nr:hypothetical protein HDU99_000752 [Rhizoclosmatium hyalinum]